LPWSRDGSLSFLVVEGELRAALDQAGLALSRLEPITDQTRCWFEASRDQLARVVAKVDATGRDRLSRLLEEVEGVLWNLGNDRLVPFFGEARPAG
jgi:hypothetical protein